MAFLEDIGRFFSKDLPVQLIGFDGMVVNCHSGIKTLTPCEIDVCFGRKKMSVKGEDLTVVYATPYEIYVKGTIKGIEFYE